MNIEELVKEAIREDRVTIYLQPIYSVNDAHIVAAEALTRIINPDGSVLPPAAFIPAATSSAVKGVLADIS